MEPGLSQIGPYRIVRKLGAGGMGAVYEGHRTDIARRVAVKVLHSRLAGDSDLTTRFINEARAVNIVGHPGLIEVTDYGQLPDGTPYIVMEFLVGETLRQRLERLDGPLPLSDVLRLGAQIADALAAAHAKNVVHRDLKPDNIMVVEDVQVPGGERAKLLDFGIAKIVEDAEPAQTPAKLGGMTKTGAMLGTPLYMSPEQCRGARDIDDRSDVYSFGVVLFVLLSGKAPFTGQGMGEIIGKHLYEPPPSLQDLAQHVPQPLIALVDRLLIKDPKQRPAMRQVADQLAGLAELSPAPAKRKLSVDLGAPTVPTGDFTPTAHSEPQLTFSTPPAATQPDPRPRLKTALPFVALALVGWVVAALVVTRSLTRPEPRPPAPVATPTPTPAPPAAPPQRPETPPTPAAAAVPSDSRAENEPRGSRPKTRPTRVGSLDKHGKATADKTRPAAPAADPKKAQSDRMVVEK